MLVLWPRNTANNRYVYVHLLHVDDGRPLDGLMFSTSANIQSFLQGKYARSPRCYLIAFLIGQGLFTVIGQLICLSANSLCLRQEDLNGMPFE